jgi:hypothetical protein
MGVLPLGVGRLVADDAVASATLSAVDVCEAVTVSREAYQQSVSRQPWVDYFLRRAVERRASQGEDWLP